MIARDAASAAYQLGLAVVPPREDGSKQPETERVTLDALVAAIGEERARELLGTAESRRTWKHWQFARPTSANMEAWYGDGRRSGVGVVCGAVSGNLECLEFDDAGAYLKYKTAATEAGLGEIVERVEAGYSERTPGGGAHWLYRCAEIGGSTKLACRPKRPDEMRNAKDRVKTLIETRGEGGYVIIAPSNGKVHPTGGRYELLSGGVETIATITPEEREALFALARMFDQTPRQEIRPARSAGSPGRRPGDDFNAKTTWAEVLEPHGWAAVRQQGEVTFWRRPGRPFGWSATTNFGGSDLLYVFSSSTPFDPQRSYNRFGAYAILNHGGDFEAAAKALAEQGFGESGSDIPYRETDAGLLYMKRTSDGEVPIRLTNFVARIVGDVAEDDGAETRRVFEIEARLAGRTFRFSVPAERFAGMGWVVEHLGPSAVLYPGQSVREHARVAVQLLSADVPERRVYTHTGWRQVDGQHVYLHTGGAVGHVGRISDVQVDLAPSLTPFALPDPPDDAALVSAVRASMQLLGVAPAHITAPIFCAVWRSVLGSCDFSLHITGPTGAGKSELAALAQQHFGAGFDSRHLPGSWSSTSNALEGLAFTAKDALLVVDDFAPSGTSGDAQKLHRDADRLLRAQGNNAGRLRMRSDASLRPARPPRGLILSTGEDTPRGQSLRARTMVLELGPGDVDFERLTGCQEDAAAGRYAQAMAAFVQRLAPRFDEIRASLHAEVVELRGRTVRSSAHRRTPEIVANLMIGMKHFLAFAQEVGALAPEEAEALLDWAWRALGEAGAAQQQHQAASEPTRRFIELLAAAIASGQAHVAAPDGGEPQDPGAWGWRLHAVGSAEYPRDEWRPQGMRVGWVDGEDLYLEPEAAYAAAQRMARESGDGLGISPKTLHKRLKERGLIASTDAARETLLVRRVLERQRRQVLHLHAAIMAVEPDQPDQPDRRPPECPVQLETMGSWSGFGPKRGRVLGTQGWEPDHRTRPSATPPNLARAAGGRVGRVGRVSQQERPSRSGSFVAFDESIARPYPLEIRQHWAAVRRRIAARMAD